jgi:hypothetical protein
VKQRGAATEGGELRAPVRPGRFRHVASLHLRIAQGERVRRRHLKLRVNGLVDEVVISFIGTPHEATLSAVAAKTLEMSASFATPRAP